ncbi:MAG: class I SAM-dependent rRNA methyltransferase [Lachnospiraceae bacterium]|nr:class I SAM-dependent rRNA methyltransferase [Lachnospiraceae bacterium]
MKQVRAFPRLIITKKGTNWVQSGHPWIYEAEVIRMETPDRHVMTMPVKSGSSVSEKEVSEKEAENRKDILPENSGLSKASLENGGLVKTDWENGSLFDAVSENGRYLGTGYLSLHSKIRLRILSTNANDVFDEAFYRRRIRYALDYRKTVMGSEADLSACRLIFGESDGFPGLTVDRFNDLLVSQVLSYGTEKNKDLIYHLLLEELEKDGVSIRGLYERNDVSIRKLEGLPEYKGWYRSSAGSPLTRICENGVLYDVDVENGQKTGFFLDQKYNRLEVARLARGKRVLDCFTHTGSFALNAARGGALSVTAVDISKTAVEMAENNAKLNGLEKNMEFITADVFELLPELIQKKQRPYDFIILDPPAFTKSRKTVGSAERGYKEINLRAMQLLPRGGYLATASCSHFMSHELFEKMLKSAAKDAGVTLKQIEVRQQAPDHPILWNVPETDYLKFYIFQII